MTTTDTTVTAPIDWFDKLLPEHLFVKDDKKDEVKATYGAKPDLKQIDRKYLCVTLAGMRYLAGLRGVSSVSYVVNNVEYDPHYQSIMACTVTCSIVWNPPYASIYNATHSAIGHATIRNVGEFVAKYVPEIAENRAYCRAVRSFLNIDVVSKEELGPREPKGELQPVHQAAAATPAETPRTSPEPRDQLIAFVAKKKTTFELVKKAVLKGHMDKTWDSVPADWADFDSIPKRDIFTLLGLLNEAK